MNHRNRRSLTLNTMDKCVSLTRYCKGNVTVSGVEARWRAVFTQVCRSFGMNKAAIRLMWEELAYGNWEHLHQTDNERSMDADWWLTEFRSDVFYCSDRWSLDRLMRCHWKFRQWKRKVELDEIYHRRGRDEAFGSGVDGREG